jgi:hypothetical protein
MTTSKIFFSFYEKFGYVLSLQTKKNKINFSSFLLWFRLRPRLKPRLRPRLRPKPIPTSKPRSKPKPKPKPLA